MKTKAKPKRRSKKSAATGGVSPPFPLASHSFPVIAMAASVGGLKALSVILGGLPPNFPAAIAIVMHVAPDHKSLLAEILNGRSYLPVTEAHNGDMLCSARVFVAPPNHHLLVAKDGHLKLSSAHAKKIHFARPSAEPLFATVARVYQKNAIAVVLTGGDGDGSFGVQIIKDKGGTVIAQGRPTSENFSMPETSIETGDVDFILPLDEIAAKLIELVERGVYAAAPFARRKPSELAKTTRDRGLKRPKGRAPARPIHSAPALPKSVTPRFAAGRKAAMLQRRK
jgi:two-component system chemotaxis response regulator CheB